MAELSDIQNDFIIEEIEEFLERPDEIQRNIDLFANASVEMQAIAAALIDGAHHDVDQLTREALDVGVGALEIMDDGLIAGMGIVGIKFRENFIFVPEVLACARAMKGGNGAYRTHLVSLGRRAGRHGHYGHGERRFARYWQKSVYHDVAAAPGLSFTTSAWIHPKTNLWMPWKNTKPICSACRHC